MVGLVIVSHSMKLAEGVRELAGMMAGTVPVGIAGGLEGGCLGTSYDKIWQAIDAVHGPDGTVILADIGSAVLTVEAVLEEHPDEKLILADCPLAEGAVLAAVAAAGGADAEEVARRAEEARAMKKISE